MKKMMMKAILATTLLAGTILGQVGSANAATAKPTSAPIMRDNLSKYGLVKDVELPVTVTAGGLSYTLEKIMVYDYNSKDALALRKLYDYGDIAGSITNPKYFIWTKITIKNNSQKLVQQNFKDLNPKWRLFFDSSVTKGEAFTPMPYALKKENNSNKAVYNYTINPGKALSTYQAFLFEGELKFFEIYVKYNSESKSQFIVNDPEAK